MLEQAILAAEDDEFYQHFGLSIPRIVVTAGQGHHPAPHARREHADAAARPQAVPDRRQDAGAKDQGGDPRDPDREALHQARDLHALLQPDVLRPRRLRRRGGLAALLRQVGEGRLARGGGADRRHPAGQRPAEPVRESRGGDAAAQLRARTDGRGRLHHGGAGRRTRRRSRSWCAPIRQDRRRRPRRTSSRKCAASSRAATAPSSSTRTACRFRPRSICGCRRPPRRRSTTACAGSTSGAASASRGATSSPRATRSKRSGSRAGIGR